jgi:hypothetical protein
MTPRNSPGQERNLDPCSFTAAKTETVIVQADFDGVSQWRDTKNLHGFAFQDPHLHETLRQTILTLQSGDAAMLART